MRKTFSFITGLVFLFCMISIRPAQAANKDAAVKSAVAGVLLRVIPAQAASFQIEIIPAEKGLDVFEIDNGAGGPIVRGSSATTILAGINWYLKYYCNAHLSWTGDQLKLPNPLPKVPQKVRIVSPYRYRYMYNYCTFNYTMSFWKWNDWERELDFLALNGVNITLAIVGQEAVWENVMRRLGMSDKEIFDFIPGPAFQAWWLMSNLEGWGGPVTQEWIDSRVVLQKKILARMRELGMEPVLQGFFGMVPRAMIKDFPDKKIVETGFWAEFKRPAMVDPTDSYFNSIAAIWYDEQKKLFGDARFFGGDPFHEGGGADINLTDAGRAIQQAMLKARPDSVWALQGWQINPRKELLDGTIKQNTLILDLYGETSPQWSRREGFYGHPWVWNIISNFGGNVSLYGSLQKVANDPVEALNSTKKGDMVGIGAMMEASMMDVVLWDLLFDMAWRTKSPDLDEWITQYATRRYGSATPNVIGAWKIMKNTVYAATDTGGAEPESPLVARPAFELQRVWGTLKREYDPCDLDRSWKLLISDSGKYRGVETYEHDLVDVTRQSLANLGMDYMNGMNKAYKDKDKAAYEKYSAVFLQLILDQDRLLATDKHFLLGKWIEDARALGSTDAEKDLFEWNARTQITTWGPRQASIGLHEYSNREWSGMLRGFYYNRWKMFIDNVTNNFDKYSEKKATGKAAFNAMMTQMKFEGRKGYDPTGIDWYAVEEKWTEMKEKYPSAPEGDPISEALRVYDKYFTEIGNSCKLK
jgi:alpha-N-acetylglucosaminidase